MPRFREARGGRVLLFDRLTDVSPGEDEVYPFIFYTKKQLRDSLRTELECLLSTRQAYTQAELRDVKRTTLSYGIPDNMHISPADATSRAALAQAITAAIRIYEPRLKDPSVVLHPVPGRSDALNAEICGELRWQDKQEMVSFVVPLDGYYEQR